MSEEPQYPAVGWIFFLVVLLLLLGPCGYVVWQQTVDSTPFLMRVFTSAFLAGFVAAIIAWIVNGILGYIAARRGPEKDE